VPVPVDARQRSWPTQPRPRQGGWTEQCAISEPLGGPVPGTSEPRGAQLPVGCLYAPHWDGAPVLSFPGHGGGADWNHMSFSQSTKLLYTGMGYVGASHSLNEGSNGLRPPGEYMTGAVVAVDVATNTVRWKKHMPYSLAHGNGILTTASDLLFIGQPDGYLIAMDATTVANCGASRPAPRSARARSPTRSMASSTSRSWRRAPASRTAPAPPPACRSATT
jgi:hypothetical protein